MLNDIELFPHNEEAYQALIKSLEESNFSFIERATGTGKSYILIKYLATKMAGKRVLFVTTHEPMFEQFVNRDMPLLGTSKNIFESLDLTIYSNIQKKDAQWYFDNYDCFIFDEAHHCGAPIWGETIGQLRDLVASSNNKVMIGATATSIRYLDEYMDVAETFFDNNVASRLTLSQAILKEILPAPIYININRGGQDLIDNIKRKLHKLPEIEQLKEIRNKTNELEKKLEFENNVNRLLKENDVKAGEKYIIFCSNIQELNLKKKEAENWFKGIANISTFEAHSSLSKKENNKQIKEFSTPTNCNEIKLMFAVDIFNEGMHVNGVDGVIMTRRTKSPIVYLQQIGRALSFSVRKKQIKIFDLVGNATDIDVIHDLYKELLNDAEEELKSNPENKEHLIEVIKRFRIVEKDNEIIDSLNKIIEYLDNNFIKKNKIDRNISYLESFVSLYNCNFMQWLSLGKVSKEHVMYFKFLVENSKDLSIEQIYRLNSIGIKFANWQYDKELLNSIKEHGSLTKAKDFELRNIINSYFDFYATNGRRPSIDKPSEKELCTRYRECLSTVTLSKLKTLIKKAPFSLNVEEMVLVSSYPKKIDLDKYLDLIESKFINGVTLDDLELRALKKIKNIIKLSERPLLENYLNGSNSKINECLITIKNFVIKMSLEGKVTENILKTDNDVINAYHFLVKNYDKISNLQFKTLLDLKIELPSYIDQTMEERYNNLGIYSSYEEKEYVEKYSDFQKVIEFIKSNRARPTVENKEVFNSYLNILKKNNKQWNNQLANLLEEYQIELTLEEKIISNRNLDINDLNEIYNSLLESIKACNPLLFNYKIEITKVKILKSKCFIDSRLAKIITRTLSLMNSVFDDGNKKIDNIVWNNKDIIPSYLLYYIEKKNIVLPHSLKRIIFNTDKSYINKAHQKYLENMQYYNEYFEYLKNNGKRPDNNDLLNYHIREYLLNANEDDRFLYLQRINKLGIKPLLVELYIANQLSDQEIHLLNDKLKSKKTLNSLEKYCLNEIRINSFKKIKYGVIDKEPANSKKEFNQELIDDIKLTIMQDPDIELDFKSDLSMLSEKDKEELKEFRIRCIAEKFLKKLINDIKLKNESIDDILTFYDLEILKTIKKINNKTHKYDVELEEIENLNKQILLQKNQIVLAEFIDEYFNFIDSHKRIPDILSLDSMEKVLAEKLELLKTILSNEEYRNILVGAKKIIEKSKKLGLYDNMINFINNNHRLPTILSNDNDEVSLAKEYQKSGSKLNAEQKRELRILQDKYKMNTVQYFMKMKGI